MSAHLLKWLLIVNLAYLGGIQPYGAAHGPRRVGPQHLDRLSALHPSHPRDLFDPVDHYVAHRMPV